MISKYHNIKTHGFHSKKEYNRYQDLCLLQRAGEITGLEVQVRYTFKALRLPSGRHPSYIADFVYVTREGEKVTEDVKGMQTPLYKLKYSLMKHFFGITIVES